MADLAIGFSKKVVDGLVKKVEGAIKEEQELWQTLERDSVFIKDEFEMMKSFLKTADRDRVRNSVVRTWVRQVRDLSYDAEDCMDDVLELEPERPWWSLPFWPRMLPTCCRPRVGRALDEAVDKIKLIKARVEEVSQRNLRYNLINATGSGPMQLAATAMDMDLDLAKVPEGSLRLRSLLNYEAYHGRLSVISVWGTGGNLGTISIIRNVFDNANVYQVYKYRAWVKLMHPFSPQKFLGDLVAQLLTNSGATCGADVLSKMEASSVDLAKEVEQLLKGNPYFVVLEDLSNMVEWYTIRTYLPDEGNGSRVVVSTQHREIARLCIGLTHYVQELSQLSADHAVYAFFKEIRMPSQNYQGSTNVASLSAAANYWANYLAPIIGRDEEVCQLYDLITSPDRPGILFNPREHEARVVTVLLEAPKIEKHAVDVVSKVCFQLIPSFELFGWVNVPNNPFDVGDFSQSLLSFLRSNSSCTFRDPVGECSRLLSEHRCLVVINGLQRAQDCSELERARFTYYKKGNCIVVITTEKSVATYWKTEQTPAAVYNMKPIAHESSLSGQQVQVQEQLPTTPPNMLDVITTLLFRANRWIPNNSPIVGRDREVDRLSRMISSSTVIVIWGAPGVGKTALVEKVYSQFVLNRSATRSFVRCGWVQVSNPFDLMAFSRSLLSVLRPQSPQSPDPIGDCSSLVRSDSCLVIIDGLQSMENFWELDSRGFIYGHHNSCIVLITTEKSVATCMASQTGAPFQVKPLDRWSSTELFRQVCERVVLTYYSDNEGLVVDKCCGVPIVILAVAMYLRRLSEDQVTQFMAHVKDGRFIHELATNTQLEFVGLKGLLAWVDSDLKACRESLKLLTMYMLNFSKEKIVRRKRLVGRWIAEGYIKNTGICDMVTEAEEAVRELVDRATMVMRVAPLGMHRGYQLSGFSGEVLMSRAEEDPLFLPLEVSALTEWKHSLFGLTSRGCSVRHLRIDDNWKRDECMFRSLDLSQLRSLTVSGRFGAFFINDSMRVLRVLDLEDATDVQSSHLEEITKLLRRLRFLSVRGCIEIDRLPDSIGGLSQLQTLDIRGTLITRLPDSILKLRNLQCLRAGLGMKARAEEGDPCTPILPWRRRMSSRLRGLVTSCSWQKTLTSYAATRGVTMPRGFSSQLTSLHTLGTVNVNTAGGEAILEELRHFKQLRKLELYGINSYNVRGLSHLPYGLDSLSLGFTKDDGIDRDATIITGFRYGLSGSFWCTRLKLHGHVGILQVLPNDTRVTDLILKIDDTPLTEDNMKRIGELALLHTLCLHFDTNGGGQLKFDAAGFPKLEVLHIKTSWSDTLYVEFAPGAVGTLKVLKFDGSLKFPTNGLHGLPFLEEVWVGRLPQDHKITVHEGHPNKPALIDSTKTFYSCVTRQ